MSLLPSHEWRAAQALSRIGHVNPFLPERIDVERRALGPRYEEEGPVIRARPGQRVEDLFKNVEAMRDRTQTFVDEIRRRIEEGCTASREELLIYEDLALYLLYSRYMSPLDGLVRKSMQRTDWTGDVPFWPQFLKDFECLFHLPRHELPSRHDPRVILAGFFQIERAFTHIYIRIIGGSMPAALLRAAVWESMFTRDMLRYVRSLHRTMADVPTLIVGPSGSGKELVARAIGLSCYVPFQEDERKFKAVGAQLYVPLNLSALSPTLIESELFGHVRGAFSGAVDRAGWLEQCKEHGAVFLDEIGELDAAIQVKLLRVLESRRFQKVGDTKSLTFQGKIIAATNRDLAAEMEAGRFRRDFYYRLCADQIVTPSLAEQLVDRPEDLPEMVRFIAADVLVPKTGSDGGLIPAPAETDGLEDEIERLTQEVVDWIEGKLGRDYPWPGNFRELGQCVRNVMIRGSYSPPRTPEKHEQNRGPVDELLHQVRNVELTTDQLLGRYYALALQRSNGSYAEAGRRVNVDWRVVKSRLDQAFLERLRNSKPHSQADR